MSEHHSCSDAAFLSAFDGHEILPHIVRLIAKGEPVRTRDLAAAANWHPADVERVLRAQPGTDWDDDGRLVGVGFTLRPTSHRFILDGRTFYAWCATDTLYFPMLLNTGATVESICPSTSEPIRIELSPEGVQSATPAETVVSNVTARSSSPTCAPRCATTATSSRRLTPHTRGWTHTPTGNCYALRMPSSAAARPARSLAGSHQPRRHNDHTEVSMSTTTAGTRQIARRGSTARLIVGVGMIVGAFVAGIGLRDALLGLVVAPIVTLAVILVRGRTNTPLRLTGPEGHCLNCTIGVIAFVFLPVAALLFYGTSMLLAAARGYAGCEVLAVSNTLLGRDDQIACPLFAPIDALDARASEER